MTDNNQIYYAFVQSPLGQVLLMQDKSGLLRINFQDGNKRIALKPSWQHSETALTEAIAQIEAYFAGQRTVFDLPLSPRGTTFQQQVWRAVSNVAYGETTSYGSIAKQINRPKASRAVGAANGQNPLPIIIPCHRIVGSTGKLTGYGGGIHLKKWLLAHESKQYALEI